MDHDALVEARESKRQLFSGRPWHSRGQLKEPPTSIDPDEQRVRSPEGLGKLGVNDALAIEHEAVLGGGCTPQDRRVERHAG